MNMFRENAEQVQQKKEEEAVSNPGITTKPKTLEWKITYVNLDRNAKLIMAMIKGLELGTLVQFLRNKDKP